MTLNSQRDLLLFDYRGRWVILDRVNIDSPKIVASSPEGMTKEEIESVTHLDGGVLCGGTEQAAVELAIKRASEFCHACQAADTGPEFGAIDWPGRLREQVA